jgi:hypothetical protein
LGFDLNRSPWLRWQLENGSFLTFSKTCQQQHDLAVRKFQRVVMSRGSFFVDLPKDCGLVVDRFMPPTRQSGR